VLELVVAQFDGIAGLVDQHHFNFGQGLAGRLIQVRFHQNQPVLVRRTLQSDGVGRAHGHLRLQLTHAMCDVAQALLGLKIKHQ